MNEGQLMTIQQFAIHFSKFLNSKMIKMKGQTAKYKVQLLNKKYKRYQILIDLKILIGIKKLLNIFFIDSSYNFDLHF